MSSTRSVIAVPPFAANALTVIPPTPVAGVSYRDPAAGPASSPDGWPYAERVNSAEFNQIMYQGTSLLSILDRKGILGWSSDVNYSEAGVVIGSDGEIYKWVSASGPAGVGAKDPTAGDTAFWVSLKAANSQVIVGSSKNVSMFVASASTTATLTADELAAKTALGGQGYLLSTISKQINLATVGINAGVGGMDVGLSPVSGDVAIYFGFNPATGASAIFAKDVTGTVPPEVYTGANRPAGYSATCLVALWKTNASRQFIPGFLTDRYVDTGEINLLTSTTPVGTLSPLVVSGVVPFGFKALTITGNIAAATAGQNYNLSVAATVSPSAIGIKTIVGVTSSAGIGTKSNMGAIPAITRGSILYVTAVGSGGLSYTISTSGYSF